MFNKQLQREVFITKFKENVTKDRASNHVERLKNISHSLATVSDPYNIHLMLQALVHVKKYVTDDTEVLEESFDVVDNMLMLNEEELQESEQNYNTTSRLLYPQTY